MLSEYSSGSSTGFGVKLKWIIHNQAGIWCVSMVGNTTEEAKPVSQAKWKGLGWPEVCCLTWSSWSQLQWTAAARCLQEFATNAQLPTLPVQEPGLLTWVFKGFGMPETKAFHNTQPPSPEACAFWGSLNFSLSTHETSPSQPVLFLINYNAWSYSLMKQMSCPSFQYFTFHCVFLAH